jgi:hypothetical protein
MEEVPTMQARIREIDMQIAGALEDQGSEEEAQERSDAKRATSILGANEVLASWFVFLGFGGFFLILYYCRIGYFPELEWEKSLTFLAAISLLGGGITAIYGLALVVPGFIWSEFLIFDQFLRQRFCYEGPDGREPCFQSLLEKLVLPFAVFMAAVHAVALLQRPWIVVLTAVVGLGALCRHSYGLFKEEIKKIQEAAAEGGRLKRFMEKNESTCLYKYTATAGVAALAGLTSFLIIYTIVSVSPSFKSAGLLFICTFSAVVSNLLVAVQFRHKPVRAILTGVVAALTLLIAGEILAGDREALSMRVMDQFGIGGRDQEHAITVVVSKAGREVLTRNHVEKMSPREGDTAAIENVRIFSRLGDEYLIEAEGRRIVLPKTMVLSWSKIRPEDRQ